MYRVVIVEDNPMVSMLNRTYTQRDSRFQVEREFSNGRDALAWLTTHPADLLILDVYMPVFTGLDLLRELRAQGSTVDAVMVTAAHERETLDALMKLGVTDYLVKPFTAERFQQALEGFVQRREAMDHLERVSQSDIDKLLFSSPAPETAPKGLQEKTLALLRQALGQAGGELTCEELGAKAGVSAVTARRYLNYMVQKGQVLDRMNYDTGGRPCMVYRLVPNGRE